MNADTFLLTRENLPDYLARRGLAGKDDSILVQELGGGVSNFVLLMEWRDFPERRWVAKQSLEKLRVKDDWRSDRARIFREAEAIQALRPVLGDSAVPEVIHVDRENYLFIMSAAPAGSVAWKDALLGRRADLAVARQAGLLLARMINRSKADPSFAVQFGDQTVFDQLGIDPYYRTTAARHPDMRERFEELMGVSRAIRAALVHGDYSPKNMLIRGSNIFLIDFEVVHWGDPSFDAAFLLNHLFLKAFHQPRFAHLYVAAARQFWKALVTALGILDLGNFGTPGFEILTLMHLGGLMLARIDGKSPVEYLTDERAKEKVRQAAKRILRERPTDIEHAIGLILEIIGGEG